MQVRDCLGPLLWRLALPAAWFWLFAGASVHGAERRPTAEIAAKAAFQIAPLVQRLETSPGRIVPFSFTAQSLGTETKIHIRPVALKQQENGLILPDETAPPPEVVQIEGGQERLLRTQENITVRGRIVAPLASGVFHSYGVLVTDLGQPHDVASASESQGPTRVSLRFVTRYLLRLETHVLGLAGEDVSQVHLVGCELAERDGLPLARVVLQNPMDTAAEFEVRCRLAGKDGKLATSPFSLMMPIRAGELGARRFQSLVLGRSRIAMESPLPEPVFPGSYVLEAEIVYRGRVRRRAAFPIVVAEDAFPAQEAQVARLGESLEIAPTQIELSLRPLGNRLLPLVLKNTSSRSVHVHLSSQPWNDIHPDWLVIRPDDFQLGPHQARKVLVALRGGGDAHGHRYGVLRVEATPDGAAGAAVRDLPVALLGPGREPPFYDLGELRYVPRERGAVVALKVANRGAEPLAPEARMVAADALGGSIRAMGGFGRWILPGETRDLEFSLPPLPPGNYRLHLEITWTPDAQPLIFERELEIADEASNPRLRP